MNKPGRPTVLPELKRRVLRTTIAPITQKRIQAQTESQGVFIDKVVERYYKEIMTGVDIDAIHKEEK